MTENGNTEYIHLKGGFWQMQSQYCHAEKEAVIADNQNRLKQFYTLNIG